LFIFKFIKPTIVTGPNLRPFKKDVYPLFGLFYY
jgi:hypothetical protein